MIQIKPTPTRRGFKVRCPHCAEADLHLLLNDVTTIRCGSCSESVTADEIREMIGQWTKLLAWLEQAPEYTAEV